MKQEYFIEYRFKEGSALSWCKNIFVVPETIEEILEKEDIVLNSIVIYTEEKVGDTFSDLKEKIKSFKK